MSEMSVRQLVRATIVAQQRRICKLRTLLPASSSSPVVAATTPRACLQQHHRLIHASSRLTATNETFATGTHANPLTADPAPEVVTFSELRRLIKSGDIRLIEVRRPEEIQETGSIPLSINIPVEEFREALMLSPDDFSFKYGAAKPSPDDENVITTCRSGKRALQAALIAMELGYKRARFYEGSWNEWAEKMGMPQRFH